MISGLILRCISLNLYSVSNWACSAGFRSACEHVSTVSTVNQMANKPTVKNQVRNRSNFFFNLFPMSSTLFYVNSIYRFFCSLHTPISVSVVHATEVRKLSRYVPVIYLAASFAIKNFLSDIFYVLPSFHFYISKRLTLLPCSVNQEQFR